MNDFTSGISESSKQMLRSFAPLLIIIILFIFVGKFSISQLVNLRGQIDDAKKTETILSAKLKTLLSVSEVTNMGSTTALLALPKSNPSLQVVSQLKNTATLNQLILSNIKSSINAGDSSGMSYLNISFDVDGTEEQIIAFIKSIDTIAPITFIEKISLTENGGLDTANVTAKTYYASLPTTIPTVTQPIIDLTTSEKVLLSQISNLSQSNIGETVFASSSAINANPFGI